jgi:LacI family transcriptional regulator
VRKDIRTCRGGVYDLKALREIISLWLFITPLFILGIDSPICLCHNNVAGNVTGNVIHREDCSMKVRKHAIRIQDVAQAAGVSVSTVSRVLNGKVDVAQDTQDRIEAVIERLGYTSSLAARSMRGQKTNMVGLIMPDVAFPYAVEIMKGVNRAIAESELDLLVYTTGDIRKHGTALHEQQYVSLLNNSITDGVVIVAPAAADFVSNAPIVSIDPVAINPNYASVHATNYQGALDAMHYLLGLGHTRIGFISGRAELESSNRRLKGYRNALEQAGLSIDEDLIAVGDYTTETAVLCTRELLALQDPPTAIFASNDQSALGIYQVARELGLRIPQDLSVVGFDNIPEAGFADLTTIDQFIGEMGYIATKMLIDLINDVPLTEKIHQVQTKLIVRNSCKRLEKTE